MQKSFCQVDKRKSTVTITTTEKRLQLMQNNHSHQFSNVKQALLHSTELLMKEHACSRTQQELVVSCWKEVTLLAQFKEWENESCCGKQKDS